MKKPPKNIKTILNDNVLRDLKLDPSGDINLQFYNLSAANKELIWSIVNGKHLEALLLLYKNGMGKKDHLREIILNNILQCDKLEIIKYFKYDESMASLIVPTVLVLYMNNEHQNTEGLIKEIINKLDEPSRHSFYFSLDLTIRANMANNKSAHDSYKKLIHYFKKTNWTNALEYFMKEFAFNESTSMFANEIAEYLFHRIQKNDYQSLTFFLNNLIEMPRLRIDYAKKIFNSIEPAIRKMNASEIKNVQFIQPWIIHCFLIFVMDNDIEYIQRIMKYNSEDKLILEVFTADVDYFIRNYKDYSRLVDFSYKQKTINKNIKKHFIYHGLNLGQFNDDFIKSEINQGLDRILSVLKPQIENNEEIGFSEKEERYYLQIIKILINNNEIEDIIKNIDKLPPYDFFVPQFSYLINEGKIPNTKSGIINYLIKCVGDHLNMLSQIWKLEEEEKNPDLLNSNFDSHSFDMFKLLYNLNIYYISESEKEKAEIRIKERDKILATVSHKIKGLIHSIQTPLSNLLEWSKHPQTIKNALKGTVLISDLVNTASHSYTANIDDFYYDAKNNETGDSIESIILDSIKYSIPHMFDGRNYNKQNRNYFKTKEEHTIAQKEWYLLSETDQLEPIIKYLNKYFFKVDFDFSDSSKYILGNDKSSSSKLITIIQELFFNAIKNVSYLEKNNRKVSLNVAIDDEMKFKVSNTYDKKRKLKTTALGTIIVKNIIESVDGQLNLTDDNDAFNAEVILPNFWKGK